MMALCIKLIIIIIAQIAGYNRFRACNRHAVFFFTAALQDVYIRSFGRKDYFIFIVSYFKPNAVFARCFLPPLSKIYSVDVAIISSLSIATIPTCDTPLPSPKKRIAFPAAK